MATTEHQVSKVNSISLARTITDAVRAGKRVTVNGETPVSYHNQDAGHTWNNGTVSFSVAAKRPGKTREVFVKVGHMLTLTIEDAAPAPRRIVSNDGRTTLPATYKGETGYLSLRVANGRFLYAVTMDERNAGRFTPGTASTERHIRRATEAGLVIDAAA